MRVAVYTKYCKIGSSSRYRFTNYETLHRQNGVKIKYYYLLGDNYFKYIINNTGIKRLIFSMIFLPYYYAKRLVQVLLVYKYDIVHIERELFPRINPVFEKFIKFFLKKKIVYEFDDAIYVTMKPKNKVEEILKLADYVIVGNEQLEDYAKNYNENICIIPTSIDCDKYNAASLNYSHKKEVSRFIIGWIGSQGTISYLENIKEALKNVSEKYNIELKVICNKKLEWDNVKFKINNVEWKLDTYLDELCDIDIGVMPLNDDEWSSGKCGFKIIQYMGVGKTFVCSPIGVNRELSNSNKNGFLANSIEEWKENIERLIEDKQLREYMEQNCREFVNEKYSIEANVIYIDDIYKKLSGA